MTIDYFTKRLIGIIFGIIAMFVITVVIIVIVIWELLYGGISSL